MRINNNISALNANRNLGKVNNRLSRTMEKLSSGLRIARAADDSAGLAISEKLRGNIKGAEASARSAQDAISIAQVGEAALEEATSLLTRAKELKVQYTGTSDGTAQTAIKEELGQIAEEVRNVMVNTKFNGKNVFDTSTSLSYIDDIESGSGGSLASVDLIDASTPATPSRGANGLNLYTVIADHTWLDGDVDASGALAQDADTNALNEEVYGVDINADGDITNADVFNDEDTTGAGNNTNAWLDGSAQVFEMRLNSNASAASGQDIVDFVDIDAALNEVVTARSTFGSYQSRLESVVRSSNSMAENYQAAESRVRDADMATEMVKFTKDSIIQQAAQSMLTQANQLPQSIIGLLQ